MIISRDRAGRIRITASPSWPSRSDLEVTDLIDRIRRLVKEQQRLEGTSERDGRRQPGRT
jgi:hypothetical protein